MPWWGIALIFLGTFLCFAVLHAFAKNKRPFRRAFLSMVIGLGTLLLINACSGWTGVYIPVSLLSVLVCTIGGIPGATLLLALNLFF
ncbi:MAG: pro-sigmaK processing inhibitor BofA family protein [Ruminococcus sp.]|nr:pro-sigmaK processing inhibitor BofA family protein [Ruminococcus sp.]